MHDLVITGGSVVDGTGGPSRTADVAITDGRITGVGTGLGPAHRTITADGLLVAPGWVDIHSHYDGQALWDRSQVLTMDEILATLRREVGPLEAVPEADPRAPEQLYRYLDGRGTVGFIASVSRPFCLNCNRIRLTADGKLRYCLFAIEETDVKSLLRGGASDAQITEAVRETVRRKWLGHEINSSSFVPPPRAMYAIGG